MTTSRPGLIAVAILQAAFEAEDWRSARDYARADLEVLDRETLVLVATAIVVESTWLIPPTRIRQRLRDRAQLRRVKLIVGRT